MEFISLDIDVKGIPIYNKISCLFQVKFIHTNNNPVLLTFWLFSFIFCFVSCIYFLQKAKVISLRRTQHC